MPILDKNNAAKVAEYTEYMENSPWANATQDLAWSKVKADWADEQVYIERDGKIRILIENFNGNIFRLHGIRGRFGHDERDRIPRLNIRARFRHGRAVDEGVPLFDI